MTNDVGEGERGRMKMEEGGRVEISEFGQRDVMPIIFNSGADLPQLAPLSTLPTFSPLHLHLYPHNLTQNHITLTYLSSNPATYEHHET